MKLIPKIACLAVFFGMCVNQVAAQTSKTTVKTTTVKTTTTKTLPGGFKQLPSGLEYKIVKHGTGKRKPQMNDHIEMNIHVHIKDSVIFDSRKMYNDKPVPFPISKAKFKGDPIEGFMLMVAGDSAVFMLSVDSMKKTGNQLLPWMKEGQKIEYDVVLVSVMSDEESKKDAESKSGMQKSIDDKELQAYFAKNHIKPTKAPNGLYYTIAKEGSGPLPKAGQNISVNYTGKLLNGKVFDSNIDTAFKHAEPFKVEIGKARVIRGWDEGLMLLNKGTKATLYIPSALAYGSQDRSPTIPANSVLVFDVEILNIETSSQAETDEKLIKDYLIKNSILATKTPSGLYYVISEPGTGETAKPGEKVAVNYTGKTLNGNIFDSNTGQNPFTFSLGAGQVIKGWDEGVQLLKKGSKATLILPSGLAYGPQSPSPKIGANAVLIFDIEVKDISK